MAQDFSIRYPLVDGHGNFGSVDGDAAAAMRYTECRLARIATEMLRDIDAETVDWTPNYDESREEPRSCPAASPTCWSTAARASRWAWPPTSRRTIWREVIAATVALIDDPSLTSAGLMKYHQGPGLPHRRPDHGPAPASARPTRPGRGRIVVRARAHSEPLKQGKTAIIVTEIPYQVNKAQLIEKIAELVREKKISEISDLRDESDRSGMRVVIELKREAVPKVVLNKLFKHTAMQTTFGVNMLALADGVPKTLSLRDMLRHYVAHQKDVIVRRTRFELDKAKKRAHILEGLLIAISNLDEVIRIIRSSEDTEAAKMGLMDRFGLSDEQAQAIVDLRLRNLTALERHKIEEEHRDLLERIAYLEGLLADEALIYDVIKEELLEIKQMYGDDRRTEILPSEDEIDIEDMIAVEEMVISITASGYVKRLPVSTYRTQHRGGIGVMGMDLKEGDYIEHLFITTTHHFLLFITSRGKIYRQKVHELPLGSRQSKGRHVANLLPLAQGEKIKAVIATKDYTDAKYLVFATRKGIVKKTRFLDYATTLKADGIIAINLDDDDELVAVRHTSGHDDLILVSSEGKAIRFHEYDVRPTGRNTMGVTGMRMPEEPRAGGHGGGRGRRRHLLRHQRGLRQAHACLQLPHAEAGRPGRHHHQGQPRPGRPGGRHLGAQQPRADADEPGRHRHPGAGGERAQHRPQHHGRQGDEPARRRQGVEHGPAGRQRQRQRERQRPTADAGTSGVDDAGHRGTSIDDGYDEGESRGRSGRANSTAKTGRRRYEDGKGRDRRGMPVLGARPAAKRRTPGWLESVPLPLDIFPQCEISLASSKEH